LVPRYELPGYNRSTLPADLVLAQVLEEAAKDAVTWLPKLVDAATLQAFGLHRPTVHSGLIASGDRFVAAAAESDALRSALPEALAVDMESAAVAQVCADWGVPFGAVRTISDRADDDAHVDFQHFLSQIARHYSGRVVRKALNLL
jgi:adenosylhomocysteine nucleosidase